MPQRRSPGLVTICARKIGTWVTTITACTVGSSSSPCIRSTSRRPRCALPQVGPRPSDEPGVIVVRPLCLANHAAEWGLTAGQRPNSHTRSSSQRRRCRHGARRSPPATACPPRASLGAATPPKGSACMALIRPYVVVAHQDSHLSGKCENRPGRRGCSSSPSPKSPARPSDQAGQMAICSASA